MKLGRIAMLVALAMSAVTGCVSRQKSGPVSWVDAPSPPTVTVQNDNWLDVAVYLIRGGARSRIGTVRSISSETFRLTGENAGAIPVQILADPIGSNARYMTDPVVLGPGQRLELRVGSPIAVSTFSVWNH